MKLNIEKNNWKQVKLGDIVTKREENDKENAQKRFDRFLKVEHMDKESLHIKRWSSQENGDEINPTFYKVFRKGQVLFPTRNPHLRRTALASFDGICGEKTLTLEPNKEFLHPEFIPFLFHSEGFYAHTTGAIVGSTNPHVRWRDVANYEFLLPPKDQQKQLSKLLWAMDDVIEKERGVLERLETQLLVNEIKYFEKKVYVKLKSAITKTFSGGTPDTKKPEYYIDGTIPWITTKILETDFISIGEKLITKNAIENSAAKILPKGNIIAGTRVGVGKFAINEVDMSFSQDINGLVVDHKNVDIEFLVYQLNSLVFQKRIEPLLRGTTIKGVIKDDLLNLPIFLPKSKDQIIIKNEMKAIKTAAFKTKSQIASSQALQKSLINQIF